MGPKESVFSEFLPSQNLSSRSKTKKSKKNSVKKGFGQTLFRSNKSWYPNQSYKSSKGGTWNIIGIAKFYKTYSFWFIAIFKALY